MTDNKPLVSVTMSTYNVEQFLEQSLDSVIGQTYTNLDIFIIDDCSTDGTQNILRRYSERDPRIRLVLRDKNEGLASSRNQAVRDAKGEYITFVDGDDIADVTMVEKAVDKLSDESLDAVIWDYKTFYNDAQLNERPLTSALSSINPMDTDLLLTLPSFAWAKMIRTESIRALNTLFPVGSVREDMPIHWKLLTSKAKIGLIPECLYYYRQQPNATTARKDRSLFDMIYSMDTIGENLKTDGLYNRYRNVYLRTQLKAFYGVCTNIDAQYRAEAYELVRNRLGEEQKQYIPALPLRPKAFLLGQFYSNMPYKVLHSLIMAGRKIYKSIK